MYEEGLRVRGKAVKSALDGIPAIKLPDVCRARLLKLIRGELNFVEKLSSGDNVCTSSNFGYFEAIVQVLHHPLVTGICSVNHKFSVEGKDGEKSHAHVDLVGMYDNKPAWFLASDRNPKRVSWPEVRNRTLQLIQAACANPVVKPSCILLYFARGVEVEVAQGLEEHFNAYKLDIEENREVESGEWLLVDEDEHREDSMGNSWISLQKSSPVLYKIDLPTNTKCIFDGEVVNLSSHAEDYWHIDEQPDRMFYEILGDINKRWSLERNEGAKVVNFDTTALIAIVSGISNGMATSIVARSATDLEKKYYSFGRFFRTQALLELQRPFLPEVVSILKEKQPVVSRFAWDEFESIVSVIGGPDEKRRASALHACLKGFIVPDCPSERVMSLPETGKIEEKHKIVFGTGDSMEATTLTANMSFIRAAVSKGMALAFIEHRPLALTRD